MLEYWTLALCYCLSSSFIPVFLLLLCSLSILPPREGRLSVYQVLGAGTHIPSGLPTSDKLVEREIS